VATALGREMVSRNCTSGLQQRDGLMQDFTSMLTL
jgi:hypothetical protein